MTPVPEASSPSESVSYENHNVGRNSVPAMDGTIAMARMGDGVEQCFGPRGKSVEFSLAYKDLGRWG